MKGQKHFHPLKSTHSTLGLCNPLDFWSTANVSPSPFPLESLSFYLLLLLLISPYFSPLHFYFLGFKNRNICVCSWDIIGSFKVEQESCGLSIRVLLRGTLTSICIPLYFSFIFHLQRMIWQNPRSVLYFYRHMSNDFNCFSV